LTTLSPLLGTDRSSASPYQKSVAAWIRLVAEVRPVDLALVARQSARPQIGLGFAARAQLRDAVAEVIGPDVTGHWYLTHIGRNF
jgi:hypothetical protein